MTTRYLYGGRSEQFKASIRRMADARVLFDNQHWRGAMYLVGYAVECRLKAALMERHGVRNLAQLELALSQRQGKEVSLREHRLEVLSDLLGLRELIARGNDPAVFRAYQRCNAWTVAWRYNPDEGNEDECRNFFAAVKRYLDFIQHNC